MKKKTIVGICMVVLFVIGLGICILTGKVTNNTHNIHDVIYGYFDDDRKYISSFEFYYDLETDDTYSESMILSTESNHTLSIYKNDLNAQVTVTLKDDTAKQVFTKKVDTGKYPLDLTDTAIEGGEYTLEISLPAKCKGTLEIRVDE